MQIASWMEKRLLYVFGNYLFMHVMCSLTWNSDSKRLIEMIIFPFTVTCNKGGMPPRKIRCSEISSVAMFGPKLKRVKNQGGLGLSCTKQKNNKQINDRSTLMIEASIKP